MFASVGPRGGPRPTVTPAIMEPDLSHLTEDERKIIMAAHAGYSCGARENKQCRPGPPPPLLQARL
ncbi:hypothetical protein EYF80_024375 [Liparis tanakae]|uniref:Uncharacterized protein n=1 Tax=Liparis tanakae TaxID=230148 RepID=A0A4Z2HKJ8_9TELE|nr:hypothetical protein EYF80_024375 [Liparis tanakae]